MMVEEEAGGNTTHSNEDSQQPTPHLACAEEAELVSEQELMIQTRFLEVKWGVEVGGNQHKQSRTAFQRFPSTIKSSNANNK